MRNFKNLLIWQNGIEIAKLAYCFIADFPKEEKFGLTTQITRAAVSISCNIAEGSSRQSNKDANRFIEISLGSAFELETQVILANNLGFGQQEISKTLLTKLLEEQKMLYAYSIRLREA